MNVNVSVSVSLSMTGMNMASPGLRLRLWSRSLQGRMKTNINMFGMRVHGNISDVRNCVSFSRRVVVPVHVAVFQPVNPHTHIHLRLHTHGCARLRSSFTTYTNTTSPKTAYQTPLKPGQIRLLQLDRVDSYSHEDGTHFNFVGTQKIVDLDDKPTYCAISYTWDFPYRNAVWEEDDFIGFSEEDEDRIPEHTSARMNLDGLDVNISSNLCRALASFAREAKTGWVWVDALCIRQDDPTERNHQVQMMRTIFSSAKEVLIFLGHEWVCPHGMLSDVAEIIENFTPSLAAALKEKRLDISELSSMSLPDPMLEEALGIEDLYRKSSVFAQFCNTCRWFSRVWCFQEVILARKTILHCGSWGAGYRFSWDQLNVLVRVLWTYHWDLGLTVFTPKTGVSVSDGEHDGYRSLHVMTNTRLAIRLMFGQQSGLKINDSTSDVHACKRFASEEALILNEDVAEDEAESWSYLRYSSNLSLVRRDVTTKEDWRIFGMLLHSCRHATCKDDLDKVYGMLGVLGLFSAEGKSLPIAVDYAKSVKDVYKDFFVFALEKTRDLGLITFQSSNDRSLTDWPSWLPDLRMVHQKPSVAARAEGLNASAGLSELQNHRPHSGPLFHVTGPRINVFGGSFDTVRQIVEVDAIQRPSRHLQDLGNILPRYICGHRRFEVIWRTLTHDIHHRDGGRDPVSVEKEYLRYLSFSFVNRVKWEQTDAIRYPELVDNFAEVLQKFETSSKAVSEECFEYVREQLRYPSHDHDFRNDSWQERFAESTISFCTAVMEHMGYRDLFVTQRGFLGSCPRGTAVDDEIWVLNGAQVPFILRPGANESSYTFVGDTFMLDLMNGEMLREEYGLRDRLRYIDIV